MMNLQHEQPLVDLTSEQAAAIAGGYRMHLHSIKAIKIGADPDGVDEAYLAIFPSARGTPKVWERSMKTGDTAQINKSVSIPTLGRTSLALFDADTFSSDDLIGIVPKLRPVPSSLLPSRRIKARLSGSGSTYVLTYSVGA